MPCWKGLLCCNHFTSDNKDVFMVKLEEGNQEVLLKKQKTQIIFVCLL